MGDQLLTVEQVSARLGMSASNVRKLAGSGQLPSQVPGLRGRWRSADIDAFLRDGDLRRASDNRQDEFRPDRTAGRE
jgi:excisionase family DNA binding protein